MRLGDFARARAISRGLLEAQPENADAWLIIAECLTKEGRLDEAVQAYQELLDSGRASDDQEAVALQCAGEILLHQGDARRAEEHFRAALKRDPYFPPAHNRLAFLLGLEGRRWESLPPLVELIKQDKFSVLHLLLLANPKQNLVIESFLERAKKRFPDYPIPRIAEAKAALEQGRLESAAELIDELLAYDREQIEIGALAGMLYLVRGDSDRFVRWSRSLNLQQESHPDCWLVRGQWARRSGQRQEAIRCFAEAFFRDPNSLEACQALTQLLPKQEDPKTIAYFEQRTKLLERLESISHFLHRDPQDVKLMEEAFACCDWLERYWEAWAWCRAALEVDDSLEWARSQKAEIEKHLVYDLPQTVIFKNIADWNYAKYPLPAWGGSGLPAESRPDTHHGEATIAFQEISAEHGLEFRYESGHVEQRDDRLNGRQMYEAVPGGGVGAIDYDLDQFPDVYLTQGARRYDAPEVDPISDRLFRNRNGERFVDVTGLCGIEDLAYSHGVAAGDLNSDGFPDLYVGNLGVNRLFVNNGDGTFSNASSGLPRLKGVWTSSVAIVDLNEDGHPDLYDVNYLQEEAYERLCEHDNGYMRACNPRIFPAEPDRILLSNADGTFRDASAALPPEADDSRGLGILIADYFQTGRLQWFIANDMTANNLYVPASPPESGGLSLRDEGLIRGLALDRRGRAQACMGVAFGDLDGNRAFDLFVTNFYGDYNTLYLQEQEMFSDLSHSSGVAALSYQMLGFGSQALDADLDGDLDLFVANGHIDDFTFQGIPYRMRPQLLVNGGAARFKEVEPQQAGPYFSRELLGRGATRLDWNRDGREDIIVSHLDTPASLLSNESHTHGQALRLSLVGTKLSRDATGTRVEFLDGNEVRIAQISAGSGYLASNENILILAVLKNAPVTIRIRWPDQTEVQFSGLTASNSYRIVEGSERPYLMP